MRKLTTNSLLSLELPVSGDKDNFHSLYGEGTFHVGDLFPAFTGIKKGQGVFLAPTISQATLTPNNQYAKVVYVGLAYSAPLHSAHPDNPVQKPSPH